jgi:DNA-directed RNA polymerase subunit RPC12/RpoP
VYATRISVTTSDEVADLRRQVLYGLAVDSIAPSSVFRCVQCGTIIGFTDTSQIVQERDVDCPECGAFNTLKPS